MKISLLLGLIPLIIMITLLSKPVPNSPFRPIILPEEYAHLERCDLTQLKRVFGQSFKGAVEAYTYERGIIIVRQVYGVTKEMHEPDECLSTLGYRTSAHQKSYDREGREWSTFTARTRKNHFLVRSMIVQPEGEAAWHSTREWYWSAALKPQATRYLAITELEALEMEL